MDEDRDATRWLNYSGDVRSSFASDRALGPNIHGQHLWPVEASYSPEADRTRVGFSKIPPS